MANSDGQVRIDIVTNAKAAAKDLQDYDKVLEKNFKTAMEAPTAYGVYDKAIQENIKALKELAIGGQENSKSFKEIAAKTREYQEALNKADAAVNNATGGLNQQNNAMSKLASTAKGLIGAYLGIQGVRAVINYSAQAVEAFRTQEIAVNQLEITLRNAGAYTAEYSSHIQQLASTIQEYSNYGDEAIIKAQAMGQAYIGNTKITDELTKATIDFAAATGMDLEQAFSLVGKSIGSETNALGRYGIQLEKGMTDAQKMEAIQKQLGDRYAGTAKEMANASTQLKNALSDLSEQFGAVLNPAVEKTQNVLIQGVQKLTQWIKQVRILKAEIKSLSIDDLTTRYQENMEYIAQLESGSYDSLGVEVNDKTTGVYGELYQKYKKDNVAILAQIKKIKEADKELQKNAKSFKMSDDIGFGGVSNAPVQKAQAAAKQTVEKIQEQKGAYQLLTEQVNELTAKLRDLAVEGQTGSQVWNEYKSQLDLAKNELAAVDEAFKDVSESNNNSVDKLSNSISTGLINALKDGSNAFEIFANVAVNAIEEVIQEFLKTSLIKPLLSSVFGGFGGLFSLFGFKNGGIIPFARGGVVNKPTLFPMANGGTGLMGEAGAEAVMPLRRMSNGRLGVEADTSESGQVVNIYNYSGASVETRKKDDNSIDVFIRKVNDALANERTSSGFRSAYSREDKRGVQAV